MADSTLAALNPLLAASAESTDLFVIGDLSATEDKKMTAAELSSLVTTQAALVQKATLTTKGDLYVATAAGTVVRQAVGTDNFALFASSADTNGIAYKDVYSVPQQQRVVSGTSDTLVLADAGKKIVTTNASAVSITVPPSASVAYTAGISIDLLNEGAGIITVVAGSGVTIHPQAGGSLVLGGQYAPAQLFYRGSNVWYLAGALA